MNEYCGHTPGCRCDEDPRYMGVDPDDGVTPAAPAALLSDAELAAIEARAVAATPGPWRFSDSTDTSGAKGEFRAPGPFNGFMLVRAFVNAADVEFIAAARQDVPALLAHIDALTAERDRFQRQGADLQASYDEHCDAEAALRTERDALRARLDAAEAGIAAAMVEAAENRAKVDGGFAAGVGAGLSAASAILAESDAARIVGES